MADKQESDDRNEIRIENREWLDSLDYVLEREGTDRARELLRLLQVRAQKHGVSVECPGNTPYINTIPAENETPYPGSREIERRIKSINRWNAMAMVVRANKESDGIGGHISTYASLATLLEVGYNHFFHGPTDEQKGDIVYFQGHASPGVYARAFLEGRLSTQDLHNFRRELNPEGGLSSYPHPWLMPEFWQFPTVSMGLAPIMAIYQARFNRYLHDNELADTSDRTVWAFVGDGEMDEPESKGALTLASREHLDNLIFVVNCNLQRLDGPVRGNGQIIQELEAAYRGAGWNVIKVVWGSDWDPLFEHDTDGLLVERLNGLLDGWAQKYAVSDGAFIREHLFGQDPEIEKLVENYSDEQLEKLRRGGHDPVKVFNAYKAAMDYPDGPTVILAQTIKGYGLGEAGEGRNVTHQQKKLNEEELREFRSRFGIPISDEDLPSAPFYRPDDESEEMKYVRKRREMLGGMLPKRTASIDPIDMPSDDVFAQFFEGSKDREVATTMVAVRLLSNLLDDESVGRLIVPIIPDEARTFGMDSLFRKVGIYSHLGQLYEPVDKQSLLYYKEAKNGAILEEGITEAGSISSFIAAGTAYATHGLNMMPFFMFYSMFGFQRVGDLVWAAGDSRTRGFLVGGTSGRTTLPGEGLQHQDGQSHVLALSVPNLKAYDPTFAYEIAVIIREGIRRMYVEQEDLLYYITVTNETYTMPPMPEDLDEQQILKGLYRFKKGSGKGKAKAHLLGSGALLNEALRAQELLHDDYSVKADVWSATSYKELYLDAIEQERLARRHPNDDYQPYLSRTLTDSQAVYVAVTDYLKALPLSIRSWVPGPFAVLGTDGFGRSDAREELRDYFEVDAKNIVLATLAELHRSGDFDSDRLEKAIEKLGIDPDKPNPVIS